MNDVLARRGMERAAVPAGVPDVDLKNHVETVSGLIQDHIPLINQ